MGSKIGREKNTFCRKIIEPKKKKKKKKKKKIGSDFLGHPSFQKKKTVFFVSYKMRRGGRGRRATNKTSFYCPFAIIFRAYEPKRLYCPLKKKKT